MWIIEMLSDLDKINLLKKAIAAMCIEKAEKESNFGRYDVKESLMAIWNVKGISDSIEAFSFNDYVVQFERRITEARDSTENPGKENGGLGTYNELLRDVSNYHLFMMNIGESEETSHQNEQPSNNDFWWALLVAIAIPVFFQLIK
jgi:hypothetical protein